MNRSFTYAQLHAYLLQQCTKEEADAMREYLETAAGKQFLEAYMSLNWENSAFAEVPQEIEDKAYQTFIQRKDEAKDDTTKVVSLNRRKPVYRWLKYAAAVIVLFTIGLQIQKIFIKPDRDFFTFDNANSEIALEIVKTDVGQRAEIKLADGSTVFLGPKSELQYPAKFSSNERKVFLRGQGYFDIQRNPNQPFRIASNNYITTVLGTSFLIDSYQENRYKLLVSSGKVQVEKKNQAGEHQLLGILTKGYGLTDEEGTAAVKNIDSYLLEAWLNKDLVFNGERLKNIVEEINRNYTLQITITNPQLEDLRITTVVRKGSNIEKFLTQSSEIFGFKFDKDGDHYLIH